MTSEKKEESSVIQIKPSVLERICGFTRKVLHLPYHYLSYACAMAMEVATFPETTYVSTRKDWDEHRPCYEDVTGNKPNSHYNNIVYPPVTLINSKRLRLLK